MADTRASLGGAGTPSAGAGRRPGCARRALAAAAAAAAGAFVPAVGSATPAAGPPASVPLASCRLPGLETAAWCGSVRRPLDPQTPGGRTIEVHFAVLPALARVRRPDAVVFFAGGPGQSAIDLAGPVAAMLGRLNNRRDIVLVDQRGTGRSAPLMCPTDTPAAAWRPLAEGVDIARRAAEAAACREALQRLPHGDLRHYTTAVAMDDVRAVLDALGIDRANLVGASYGTRAALEFARRFPDRVRRSVLDGVAPPDMALPESGAPDTQAALDALFAACEAETDGCARRHPRLRERFRAFAASLPRTFEVAHPLSGVVEPLTLTRDGLIALVRAPLYAPALAAGLPAALDAAIAGRPGSLAALASSLGGSRAARLATGMHLSVVCSEDLPPAGAVAAPAPAASAPDVGRSFADAYAASCAGWPRGDVPPDFRRLSPTRSATWLLSGGLDPVTPPRHGARVAAALGPLARHEVVPNAGHGTLALACVRDAVVRFVEAPGDADALAIDARCAAALPRPPAFVPPGPAAAAPSVPSPPASPSR
jgi:pimeloyl-ACP methyl ester carboxylesterase